MSVEEKMDIHKLSSVSSIRKGKEKLPLLKDMKRETIGQTYQYVNQLVLNKQSDDFENINELLTSNEQLPMFEDKLRLIIIDSLKMEDEVVKVLLSQNNYQIKRILRCKWFFQSSLSPDYYCMKIFPHISVSLRYKVINRLSKNLKREKDAEELFNSICSDYCYQQAEILLPKCSSQFILDFFNEKKPKFESDKSSTILLKITQRYPNIGFHILNTIYNENDFDHIPYGLSSVCLYLAGKHPQIFIPFFEKHHLKMKYFRFGAKLSQKLGLKLKDFLIQSSNVGMFKQTSLFRILSFEDQAKYFASRVKLDSETLSLENWTRTTDDFVPLLKLLPPNHVLPIIESTFKQVYNLNYSDCPKAWELRIFEMIPLAERLPYVELLEKFLAIDNDNGDRNNCNLEWFLVSEINEEPHKLIYLKECSVAFNEFKRILAKAPSLNERERILRYAVRNCVINKDAQGLEQLLEHVRTRLRNENHKLIYKILEEISESFPQSALTLSTVRKLEEICYLGAIRGDYYHYYLIMEKCILRMMEEGMDVQGKVKNVVDLALSSETVGRCLIDDVRSKHSASLFLEYYREIFRWIKENPSKKETKRYLVEKLLESVGVFNFVYKKNSKIRLRDLPELFAEVEEILKKTHEDVSFDFDWMDLWERFSTKVHLVSYRWRFFRHTLKRNPKAVLGNMEPVWKYLYGLHSYNWTREKGLFIDLIKIFSFLGQTDKVKETLLDRFKTADCTTAKVNALKMYARLCDVEEFEKAIQVYIPKEGKLNVEEEANFLQVQLAIPLMIKDLKPDCKNLPLISKFLTRDFLKNVSLSFMSYCYHTRVDIVVPALIKLLNDIPEYGRIAYEKNVVRLIAEVVNRREKLEFCSKRWEESRHYSVRTILLRFISKTFLEHPTQESFQVLSKCILESDEVIIQAKPDINRVPKEFINDYVTVLWKFSESQPVTFRRSFRNSVLWFFSTRNVGWLSEELSQDMIKSNLFKCTGIHVDEFAVSYLLSDSEKVESRMKMVLNLLRDSVVDESTVSSFLRTLKTTWAVGSFVQIFDIVLKNWPDSVPLSFDERLSLNYFSLLEKIVTSNHQEKSGDVVSSQFGERLKAFYSSFENSSDFLLIFSESLGLFFNHLGDSKKKLNIVSIALELLAHPSSRSLAILAILILPVTVVEFYKANESGLTNCSSEKGFINVIKLLEDNQDEVVQIYFRRKFGFKKL